MAKRRRKKIAQTFEWPEEFDPKRFRGPLPDDHRTYLRDYVVATKEEILLGPTPIMWDVLYFVPPSLGKKPIFIMERKYEVGSFKRIAQDTVSITTTKIYRWHSKGKKWLLIL